MKDAAPAVGPRRRRSDTSALDRPKLYAAGRFGKTVRQADALGAASGCRCRRLARAVEAFDSGAPVVLGQMPAEMPLVVLRVIRTTALSDHRRIPLLVGHTFPLLGPVDDRSVNLTPREAGRLARTRRGPPPGPAGRRRAARRASPRRRRAARGSQRSAPRVGGCPAAGSPSSACRLSR